MFVVCVLWVTQRAVHESSESGATRLNAKAKAMQHFNPYFFICHLRSGLVRQFQTPKYHKSIVFH